MDSHNKKLNQIEVLIAKAEEISMDVSFDMNETELAAWDRLVLSPIYVLRENVNDVLDASKALIKH